MTGPNPVDRGKPGSKIHVVSDRAGLPLAVWVSAANLHDSQALKPLLVAIPESITTRTAPLPSREAARRQSIRRWPSPPMVTPPRHRPAHRPQRRRVLRPSQLATALLGAGDIEQAAASFAESHLCAVEAGDAVGAQSALEWSGKIATRKGEFAVAMDYDDRS